MLDADDASSLSPASFGKVRLLFSIDVEEEGLFCGRYARTGATVNNVPHLTRLAPALARFSLPVTLLCTHRVFNDKTALDALDAMRKAVRVEIGAHLHHWDTPPFEENIRRDDTRYICPGGLSPHLFRQRLESLFTAGKAYNGAPLTSFRMGRWHLHRWHWPYLADTGALVDSSVRPLHYAARGPDFFAAPAEPYYVPVSGALLIESPMTCLPLYRALPSHFRALEQIAGKGPAAGAAQALKSAARAWGVLGLTPVYHPLWAMKRITKLHLARGGRFLSMTCHSSELMPGGAPHMPDEAAVNALIGRMEGYLSWLHGFCPVQGMTLDDLRRCDGIRHMDETDADGDWLWRPQPSGAD
ncbi:MAG: glycosyl transferase family 1 [Desulfovibrio sp.]|jgi:hypothetical protein|nr:glycosyl transferase family 1 [Desulfovibrio sp.]